MPWPDNNRETGYRVTAGDWNNVATALQIWGGNSNAANQDLHTLNILCFGDPSTDGSWRFQISGNNFVLERRESGNWATIQTFTSG